jgi:hypothetical protein
MPNQVILHLYEKLYKMIISSRTKLKLTLETREQGTENSKGLSYLTFLNILLFIDVRILTRLAIDLNFLVSLANY